MIETRAPLEKGAEHPGRLSASGPSPSKPKSGDGARAVGLKIGIEATCWHNDRGYGRHARALLGSLLRLDVENNYCFFMDAPPSSTPPSSRAELRVIASKSPASLAASANGHRSPSDMWRMSRALGDRRFDLLIFPSVYSYVPVFSRAKKIVFIHDVIAETFPQLTLPNPRSRLFWRAKVALALRQADAVATVSEYARLGLIQKLKVRPDRIHVVGEASDPIFNRLAHPEFRPKLEEVGLSRLGRLVVYVGGFGPHKNLNQLMRVFATLSRLPEFIDARLVLVGEYQKEVFYSQAGVLRAQVEELGLGGRVIFTGFLPDDDLVVLLNRATVLVLPSMMEGFGLPAVEAAACGCPVIATTASPLPDLLGGGGLYTDPQSAEQLEQALRHVLSSEELRIRMSAAGLEAASRLTWDAAARQLQSVIRKVVAQ
jgi:glycosyltransferase involved in cell wall biosynthesis